jgi:mannose-1-phosphate guanylyltransferase
MQALVLVGGEGTRLRPLTLTQPKPAVQLVDRPFIRFMVDWLGRHGVDDVVMACGFRAELLRRALGERTESGTEIRYVSEDEPLGTAGPIRLAADSGLLDERFMVLNGDVLTDLDLSALQAFHTDRDAVASLALYPVDDPTSYGLVRRDESGAVRGFLEKPDPEEIDTDEINAGAYVLDRAIVDLIPPGRSVSIERDVFPRLVGQGLFGLRLEGYWMDIGTPERYLQASWDIIEGRVQTDVETSGSGPFVAAGAEVAADANVGPRAVVGEGASVGSGATVEDSVLLAGSRVGERASVTSSILAQRVEIGAGASVGAGSIVGEGAVVPDGAEVAAGARVDPAAEAVT